MKQTIITALLLSALVIIATNTTTYAQCTSVMTTWIGDSTVGYTGDGGPANLAEIAYPIDVCFDAEHNLYFTDAGNNVIRKISGTTGIISTIAGNGIWGYSGSGLATNVSLANPQYLCVDNAGNIYFTEGANSIRKINTTTGMIAVIGGSDTVVGYSGDGSLATNALLNTPQGICTDLTGNIYFADQGNDVIRKISATTGIITTIAGNGTNAYTVNNVPATSAMLSQPTCVRVDNSGNIYIADYGDFVIRKVTAATGLIKTIAGNGIVGYTGDNGPAVNAEIADIEGMFVDGHGDIYINDISCSCRKINGATGVINIVAGNGDTDGYNGDGGCDTTVLLNSPFGVCVDPSNGNIIIADQGNNRIRVATQPGFIPTNTSVSKITPSSQISIFPNPSYGEFTIQSTVQQSNTTVQIFNTVGELIYTTSMSGTQNDIDIRNQPPGIYFINIRSADQVQTTKMVVK